jgi:hypothetical protein
MKNLISLFSIILLSTYSFTQELRCNVLLDASQIQSQETQIFEELKVSIEEFMNTTRWTEDEFEDLERIDCNLSIQLLTMPSVGVFTATAQFQSNRPIYNTDYKSIILNYVDKEFNFTYQQGTALYYGENQFSSDLTSLLALYSNIIIGLDYASFSDKGGAQYFDKAQNIFLTAQSSGGDMWLDQDDVNGKYSLMSDLINTQLSQFQTDLYNYHLKSLDIFVDDQDACLDGVLLALESIQQQKEFVSYSILINSFFFAKSTELIRLFEKAPADKKKKALDILTSIDAKNREKYESKLR